VNQIKHIPLLHASFLQHIPSFKSKENDNIENGEINNRNKYSHQEDNLSEHGSHSSRKGIIKFELDKNNHKKNAITKNDK